MAALLGEVGNKEYMQPNRISEFQMIVKSVDNRVKDFFQIIAFFLAGRPSSFVIP